MKPNFVGSRAIDESSELAKCLSLEEGLRYLKWRQQCPKGSLKEFRKSAPSKATADILDLFPHIFAAAVIIAAIKYLGVSLEDEED